MMLAAALVAMLVVTAASPGAFPAKRDMLLAIASSPDAAFLLVVLGTLAVLIEFIRPGLVVPGVTGAFAITLGAWAFTVHGTSLVSVQPVTALSGGIPVTAAAAILFFPAYLSHRTKTRELVPVPTVCLSRRTGEDKPTAIRIR
jgi:hypothetical protein